MNECGILGCPYDAGELAVTVGFEDDFGVAIEREVRVCHDHLVAITGATHSAVEKQRRMAEHRG